MMKLHQLKILLNIYFQPGYKINRQFFLYKREFSGLIFHVHKIMLENPGIT